MSLQIYDTGLIKKIEKWTSNTNVHIYGPEETTRLIEILSDESNDSPIKLPIIAITHQGGYTLDNSNKRPLSFDGKLLSVQNGNALSIGALPITIPYRVNIYTGKYAEADAYCRELMFAIINHPTFKVRIPYNGIEQEFNANIYVKSGVEERSDFGQVLSVGKLYRMAFNIEITDAYLWDVKLEPIVEIDADGDISLTIVSDGTDVVTEEIKI